MPNRQQPGIMSRVFTPALRKRVRYIGALGLLAVLILVAVGAVERNHDTGASKGYAVTAATKPQNAIQDYNQAEQYKGAGQCDRAIPLYLSAIHKSGSLYTSAYQGLGNCYVAVGQFSAGLLEYNRAIQIDPTGFGIYINRGDAEVQNGSAGAAINDYLTALQFAPHQVLSYTFISQKLGSAGDLSKAIMAMGKAIAIAPHDASLYQQRANIYLSDNEFAAAYYDYRQALKNAPFASAKASIYDSLASVYDQQQNYPAAFQSVDEALSLDPHNVSFIIHSGDIRKSAGKLFDALVLYNKALKLASARSDIETIYQDKADNYAKMGQIKAAVAAYNQAIHATAPSDIAARASLKNAIKALLAGQS